MLHLSVQCHCVTGSTELGRYVLSALVLRAPLLFCAQGPLPIVFTLRQASGAVCRGRQLASSWWNNKHALTAWQLLRSSTAGRPRWLKDRSLEDNSMKK